ncbi:acyl carrier protein [Micromonospora sp. NPDC048170]|uniref:acyl carrier protein n=1 Tax=Micromonospora sp. NPDC048170 TaxID=3154819 RepID=UPI0033F53683
MDDDPILTTLLVTAQSVFGIESLAPKDDLFALGATSVDAVRLVSALEADHGLVLDMEVVFESENLAEMASKIVPVA